MLAYLFVVNKSSGNNQSTKWDEIINEFFIGKELHFKIYHLPEGFTITQIKDSYIGSMAL